MLYYVENTNAISQRYCGFDMELGIASPWAATIEQIVLDNERKLWQCWPYINGKSHDELISYFNNHSYLRLLDVPNVNDAYEYW